jgi:hypothetical protein
MQRQGLHWDRSAMELSDQLFADIRKTLGLGECDDTGRSISGRRGGRTDAAQVKVEIEHVGARQGRHAITLLDFAKRGVSLLDNRAWGAGEKFVMYLPRTKSHVIRFLCVVRNSRVVDDQFRIGAEFVDEREAPSTMVIRSQQAMAAAAAVEAAAADTEASAGRRAPRKRFRKAGAWAQLHTFENGAAGPILEADVVDLSDGGVGFICARELPVGQKLMVRCCPAGGKAVTRMCEVVTCRAADAGGFRIGTRFIEYKGRSLSQTLGGWFRAKG